MGVAIFFFIVAGVFALWGAISPQHMWQVMQSWRYKNPEANRPSEAQHALTRGGSVIALIAIVILIPVTVSIFDQIERQNQRHEYEDCLAEHRGQRSLMSPREWCEDLKPPPNS